MGKSNEIIGMILNEKSALNEFTITEHENNYVRIRAILQDFMTNRNKRLYEKAIITESLGAPHIAELERRKTWYGECGHPFEKDLKRQMTIKMPNASHKILEHYIFEDRVEGDIQTTFFEIGKTMRDEITQGLSEVAFSMRGAGPMKREGNSIKVQRGLKILCYDWVVYPSHKNAYQQYIIRENAFISDINNLQESFIIPITEGNLYDIFGANENVKILTEELQFNMKDTKLVYNEKDQTIILEDAALKVAVFANNDLKLNKKYLEFMKDVGRM